VFDGLFVGNLDAGTTSFDGRFSSGVCAARHEQPPEQSNPAAAIATTRRCNAGTICAKRAQGKRKIKPFFSLH
jgi:hypothetical protein